MIARIRLLFVLLLTVYFGSAQTECPPFWSDIVAFKNKDAATRPPQHAILFVGSSSFTKWTDVQDYFPGYTIINRGFGGSTLVDVIRYAQDIILPYQPKQVVIYCGDNDLASSDSITATDVLRRFKTLYAIIRQNLPNTVIDFVSIKPSPSRARLMPKMAAANTQIQQFLKHQKHAGFINVYSAMLDSNGQPKAELFLEDQLHMKPVGYQIWQKIIRPYLMK
jgi:lysophospholipase L1-like esterase